MTPKKNSASSIIQDFLSFLNDSPTSWHAVHQTKERLLNAGFEELKEEDEWKLKPHHRYFVIRNGSLSAFITPTKLNNIHLVGSHTDSPGFKLKPNGDFVRENMRLVDVEVYGSPLLTSWLNRDLGIAGRISILNKKGEREEHLVKIDSSPLIIPQLAVHLDRKVNDEGLLLNRQEHFAALAGLIEDIDDEQPYLENLLKKEISFQELLAHELFLYPLEPARMLGLSQELIASWRIDSLGSVHAALTAFITQTEKHAETMPMLVFWDHEEVGSYSAHGAASPFLPHTLERVCMSLGLTRTAYLRLLSQSTCLSVDLTHALHPHYPQRHDPRHQPLLGKGSAIKFNAQQRYATNSRTAGLLKKIAHDQHLTLQEFVSRSDIPCGTTIGPVVSTHTGIPTVDLGYPQLSMHSVREVCATHDHLNMVHLLGSFFHSSES